MFMSVCSVCAGSDKNLDVVVSVLKNNGTGQQVKTQAAQAASAAKGVSGQQSAGGAVKSQVAQAASAAGGVNSGCVDRRRQHAMVMSRNDSSCKSNALVSSDSREYSCCERVGGCVDATLFCIFCPCLSLQR